MTETVRSDHYYNPSPYKPVSDFQAEGFGTPPAAMTDRSLPPELPTYSVSKKPYVDEDFARREIDQMWLKTWQCVCRERSIPDPGDFHEYRIGDQTVIVLRSTDGSIRAYHNVCLHRGTALVTGDGNASQLRCPFHGWTWNLDGSLKDIPCRWDFPQVEAADVKLRELRIETWDGWIFVNFDRDARSLAEHLGADIIRHFDYWRLQNRPVVAHVARKINANWKIVLQQFIETYHAYQVHPQALIWQPGSMSQYDIYPGGHSRYIALSAVVGPELGYELDEREVFESIIDQQMAGPPGSESDGSGFEWKEDDTARSAFARMERATLHASTGKDYSDVSDSELIDYTQYCVFPNLVPFTSFNTSLCFRFTPDGTNPDWSTFEVMIFGPEPEPGELPTRDAPIEWLDLDQPFSSVAYLGGLGLVVDQDIPNSERLTRGLKSNGIHEVILSRYQEGPIRSFLAELMRYVEPDA